MILDKSMPIVQYDDGTIENFSTYPVKITVILGCIEVQEVTCNNLRTGV